MKDDFKFWPEEMGVVNGGCQGRGKCDKQKWNQKNVRAERT